MPGAQVAHQHGLPNRWTGDLHVCHKPLGHTKTLHYTTLQHCDSLIPCLILSKFPTTVINDVFIYAIFT